MWVTLGDIHSAIMHIAVIQSVFLYSVHFVISVYLFLFLFCSFNYFPLPFIITEQTGNMHKISNVPVLPCTCAMANIL